MEIEIVYRCLKCKSEYDNKNDAIKCSEGDEVPELNVGDIVEAKYGYGWFDGDKRWVINPDVDMSKHGFGPDCSMGFYYVVALIEREPNGHRMRYYLRTGAMTGDSAHHGGYTTEGHHKPTKVDDPPEFVVEDSKRMIAAKLDWLL